MPVVSIIKISSVKTSTFHHTLSSYLMIKMSSSYSPSLVALASLILDILAVDLLAFLLDLQQHPSNLIQCLPFLLIIQL